MHHLHNFNHWAVLVSAVIQWILGAIWYSPALFAKPWMAALGITPDPSKKNTMIAGMIMSFIGSLVLSFVLLHVILWSGAGTTGTGALVGFIMWLGFIAAPTAAQNIYEGRAFRLFAINTGYWFVGMVITGAMLAIWK
jgi:hypothetical protein